MTSLQIHPQVDTTVEIEQKLIRQRNGKLLVDIQGKLEILVNGKCFFLEPALALLEFGVALSKWDRMNDFYYYTMEHDEREGPIIAFIHDDRGWRLDSIWREFDCEERLPDYTITEAVDHFLANVDGAFMRYYGINTRDFI
ncbi:hypothetical protein QT711_16145 [Sporosarcina saromensis]|uniref:DUF7878 domain-containing protein n=1 Tax=Sporosarcina saromensis TaxID=359365 RepID=A0ABU4GEG8_9BACL|nr:hypothetical protein [Sporosarcina saromensis]MDW0114728.1 hypothetical protein [Sporosarcina saromensis]